MDAIQQWLWIINAMVFGVSFVLYVKVMALKKTLRRLEQELEEQ